MNIKSVLFFIRNNPGKHIVVRNTVHFFSKVSKIQVLELKNILKDFRQIDFKNFDLIYIDDPLAFIVFYIFFKKKNHKILFHSLEMYEHQLELVSLKNRFRKFIFEKLHYLALVQSDYILFPNEVRRNYYLERLLSITSSKIAILENIPYMVTKDKAPAVFKGEDLVKEFVSKHKKTLVFAGAIKAGRDVTKIIKLFSEQKEYGLCVISSNSYDPKDINFKNDSVLLLSQLNHLEVLKIYPYFDAGLLFYENEPMNVKYCAPVKIYEYNEFGLRIISNNNFSSRQSLLGDYVYLDDKGIIDYLKSIPNERKANKHYSFEESFNDALASLFEKR